MSATKTTAADSPTEAIELAERLANLALELAELRETFLWEGEDSMGVLFQDVMWGAQAVGSAVEEIKLDLDGWSSVKTMRRDGEVLLELVALARSKAVTS